MNDHDYVLMPPDFGWGGHTLMFAEAWVRAGGRSIRTIKMPHILHTALSRTLGISWWHKRKRLILPTGWRIDSCAWPYCWAYEIVPMMWDLWPRVLPSFIRFLKRNQIKLVFCTQRANVDKIMGSCPNTRAIWIPEGIDTLRYPKGPLLNVRNIDVFSYGRKIPIAATLEQSEFLIGMNLQLNPKHSRKFLDLTAAIRDAKIVLCYPRCDTHPCEAGGLETLTQRYWECMLSGTLMVGRAPKELIDLCGYNPVIELGDMKMEKIRDVLNNIGKFQDLVDRNEAFARANAGWETRIPMMLEALRI